MILNMKKKEAKVPLVSKQKQMENDVFDEYMELRKIKGSMKMAIYEYLGKKYKRSNMTIRCIVVRVAKRRGIKINKL